MTLLVFFMMLLVYQTWLLLDRMTLNEPNDAFHGPNADFSRQEAAVRIIHAGD
jgi:hypothetical protein